MGLDMYLNAKKETPVEVATLLLKSEASKDTWDREVRDYLNESWIGKPAESGQIVTVVARVGYWRKAYCIDDWFRRRLDGIENCEERAIPHDVLERLKRECEEVIAAAGDTSILSPDNTFCTTEYPDNLLYECEDTINQIKAIENKYNGWDLYYSPSW